jgi:hypothetical protein
MHKPNGELQAKSHAGKRGVKVVIPARSILILMWGSFFVEGAPETSYTASRDVYGLVFEVGDRDIKVQFVDDDQGTWAVSIVLSDM